MITINIDFKKRTVKITFNDQLSAWAADTIAPASMHILCIGLRYNKPNKPENHEVSYLLCFFNNTKASVLSLGF